MKASDTILVGWDYSKGNETSVLIVGRKRMNQSVEIINAFQGKEAEELYQKLVTVKEDKNENGKN